MSFRKKFAKASRMFLALCLAVLSVAPTQLKAAEKEYTYTIRFFAGAQGTIDGQEMVVEQDCRYGQQITFNQNRIRLKNDSKYYVRGIRESGRDNDEILVAPSFQVKEDADYVVAYGILGEAVMYTVEYVDANGNTLAPSETYYGNVGDRPVVAFIYIEGYQPQAYNLTGTLNEDASRNVFRFIYTPIFQPAVPVETTPTPATGSTLAPSLTTEGTENPEPETSALESEDTPEPETDIPEEDVPLAKPDQIQDINDPDVPLANGGPIEAPAQPNGFVRMIGNIPLAAKVLIGLAVVAAAGTAWFFLMHRKKKADGKI